MVFIGKPERGEDADEIPDPLNLGSRGRVDREIHCVLTQGMGDGGNVCVTGRDFIPLLNVFLGFLEL